MSSRLSSLMIQEGLLTVGQLQNALTLQVIRGGSLDTILLEKNLSDEFTLLKLISKKSGFPPADGRLIDIAEPNAATAVTLEDSETLGICPLSYNKGQLIILTNENCNRESLENLASKLNCQLLPFAATELRVLQARNKVYNQPLSERYAQLLGKVGEQLPSNPQIAPIDRKGKALFSDLSLFVMIGEATLKIEPAHEEKHEHKPTEPDLPPAPVISIDTNEIKVSKTLEPLLLGKAIVAIRRAKEPDEALKILLCGAHEYLSSVYIYAAQKKKMTGRFSLVDKLFDEIHIRKRYVVVEPNSMIDKVVNHGEIYFGPTPNSEADVVALMEVKWSCPNIVLIPIQVKARTVCLLMGHNNSEAPIQARQALVQLVEETSEFLEKEILSKKQKRQSRSFDITKSDEIPTDFQTKDMRPSDIRGGSAGSAAGIIKGTTQNLSDHSQSDEDHAKIIIDLCPPPDIHTLLKAIERPSPKAREAFDKMQSQGKSAIDSLVALFPGMLKAKPSDLETDSLPSVVECSSVLRALTWLGRPIVPYVASFLRDNNSVTRFFATYLFSQLAFPEAVALLALQLDDEDPLVRRIAIRCLQSLHQLEKLPRLIDDLRQDLTATDGSPKQAAMAALAALGDTTITPMLIDLLGDKNDEISNRAHWSLVTLTKQDFSKNRNEWTNWWEKNKSSHRIEWLIDGLLHDEIKIWTSSAIELIEISGVDFGYEPALEKPKRATIHKRYRLWWAKTGSLDFGRFS